MSEAEACDQLHITRSIQRFAYLDSSLEDEEARLDKLAAREPDDFRDLLDLEIMEHLRTPFDPNNPDAFFQRSSDIINRLESRRMQGLEKLARIRELGYRLASHDLSAASRSVLLFAMENNEGEGEEGEAEDLEDEEEGEGEEENEQGTARRRRHKVRRPRRPYRVTCALRRTHWFESSMEWEDQDFRSVYRVSKNTFWGIVDILQQNIIFRSTGRKQQRPVNYQLGVFLMRYGISGSHARHPKYMTSIGEGTVTLYCRRVIRAIRERGLKSVVWPTEDRKLEIKKAFKNICGLDGIIGALDGTLCGLETKPRIGGDCYISRKKTLSVNVQAIVDHNGVFTAFQSGWAGSRPDRGVWPHMQVYQERHSLFANGEFLLADGGYDLSPFVLIPYAQNELPADRLRRREFNRKISQARIVIEWAFGRLKARFPALRKLGAVCDMADIYHAIEAMMVVHNLCHELGDSPYGLQTDTNEDVEMEAGEGSGLVEYNEDEDEEHNTEAVDTNLLVAGRVFRERCIDIICP